MDTPDTTAQAGKKFDPDSLGGTLIVAVRSFETRMRMMHPPRVVLTPHPMGRPLGPPGDRDTQLAVVQRALDLLETATTAGTIVTAPGPYRSHQS